MGWRDKLRERVEWAKQKAEDAREWTKRQSEKHDERVKQRQEKQTEYYKRESELQKYKTETARYKSQEREAQYRSRKYTPQYTFDAGSVGGVSGVNSDFGGFLMGGGGRSRSQRIVGSVVPSYSGLNSFGWGLVGTKPRTSRRRTRKRKVSKKRR